MLASTSRHRCTLARVFARGEYGFKGRGIANVG